MSNIDMTNEYDSSGIPLIRTDFEKAGNQPAGWKSDYFLNPNQEKILYARIPAMVAPGNTSRGTVVLTTGYNDSIYNQYETIHQWQLRGYDIYAMDWASQGASQRNPRHPDLPSSRSLDYHVRDLDQFINYIVKPEGKKPLILSTHSMGGAIGALYMHDHPDTFDKAILGAPMLDLDTSILPREWFKTMAHVATEVGLKDKSLPNWRDVLYDLKNMHFLQKEKPDLKSIFSASTKFKPYELKLPTWGWVDSAYGAMDRINKPGFFRNIKTDILFVTAGHDELVDNRSVQKAAKETPEARLLNLPDSQHNVWLGSPVNEITLWKSIDALVGNTRYTAPVQIANQTKKAPASKEQNFIGAGLSPVFG